MGRWLTFLEHFLCAIYRSAKTLYIHYSWNIVINFILQTRKLKSYEVNFFRVTWLLSDWLTDVTPCSNSPTTSNSFTSFNNPKRQPAGLVNVGKKTPKTKTKQQRLERVICFYKQKLSLGNFLVSCIRKQYLSDFFGGWGKGPTQGLGENEAE